MGRYVRMPVRPRAGWADADYDDEASLITMDVYEQDADPVDAGLLDASGAKLYRVPTKIPFGFVKG